MKTKATQHLLVGPLARQPTNARRSEFRPREERLEAGNEMRQVLPRSSHATWKPPASHRDPIAILKASNRDRLPELIPIRYGRMLRSPFTFLRGSAGLMAYDLATTPSTKINVQCCGDCHLTLEAYADQNERDHAALVAAVKAGHLKATVEEDL